LALLLLRYLAWRPVKKINLRSFATLVSPSATVYVAMLCIMVLPHSSTLLEQRKFL
jgi:hypothetical protein